MSHCGCALVPGSQGVVKGPAGLWTVRGWKAVGAARRAEGPGPPWGHLQQGLLGGGNAMGLGKVRCPALCAGCEGFTHRTAAVGVPMEPDACHLCHHNPPAGSCPQVGLRFLKLCDGVAGPSRSSSARSCHFSRICLHCVCALKAPPPSVPSPLGTAGCSPFGAVTDATAGGINHIMSVRVKRPGVDWQQAPSLSKKLPEAFPEWQLPHEHPAVVMVPFPPRPRWPCYGWFYNFSRFPGCAGGL